MIRKQIPNMLTLGNLACGVAAILVASTTQRIDLSRPGPGIGLIYFACLAILGAALFDRFDGHVARRLDAVSDIGRELDSLCDLISFGVAPAVITWKLHFFNTAVFFPAARLLGIVLALIFPIAGAVRLARFNVQEDRDVFYGIPITLAGSLLTLFNLIDTFLVMRRHFGPANIVIALVLMALLSFLMVSRIRLKKI